MKYLKSFKNLLNESVRTPREFADEYDPEYKYIVYVDGQPKSGWEYLGDAIKDGIAGDYFDLFSEDEMDFEDEMDIALGEYNISVDDESDEIDEDELAEAINSLCQKYEYEGNIVIRFVDGDNEDMEEEYPEDYDLARANDPNGEYHGDDERFHDVENEGDLERFDRENRSESKVVKFSDFTNEELDRQTYLDAADQLDTHQHGTRAKKVRRHAHEFVDGETFFKLGNGTRYIDNTPRWTEDMMLIDCQVSKQWLSKVVIIHFVFDDNGDKRYLTISKNTKKSGTFAIGSDDSAFSDRYRNGVAFSERQEALRFIDYINQDDKCLDKLSEYINDISVNSVYLPTK